MIGTAGPSAQDRVRDLGAIPVDYRNENVPARMRELAPDGVAAVFDHVGGPGITDSWGMLARGGTLVSYGTASTRDVAGNPRVPVLEAAHPPADMERAAQRTPGKLLHLGAGARKRDRYRAYLRRDLGDVLQLLQKGAIDAQIAKRFPLRDAGEALRYAEQGAVVGKVVLEP